MFIMLAIVYSIFYKLIMKVKKQKEKVDQQNKSNDIELLSYIVNNKEEIRKIEKYDLDFAKAAFNQIIKSMQSRRRNNTINNYCFLLVVILLLIVTIFYIYKYFLPNTS